MQNYQCLLQYLESQSLPVPCNFQINFPLSLLFPFQRLLFLTLYNLKMVPLHSNILFLNFWVSLFLSVSHNCQMRIHLTLSDLWIVLHLQVRHSLQMQNSLSPSHCLVSRYSLTNCNPKMHNSLLLSHFPQMTHPLNYCTYKMYNYLHSLLHPGF